MVSTFAIGLYTYLYLPLILRVYDRLSGGSYATGDSINCCKSSGNTGLLRILLGVCFLVCVLTYAGPSVSKSQSSTHVPTETAGNNYTMWQEFVITLPSSSCNASDISSRLTANWTRAPYDIDHNTCEEELSIQKGKSDLELLANASLTIFNMSYWKDSGEYTVNLTVKQCNGVFAFSKFTLQVLPKCTSDVPSPTTTSIVVSSPDWVPCPKINTSFIGGNKDLYNMEWKKSEGTRLCFCPFGNKVQGRYRCDWSYGTDGYASCNYSTWLEIGNCTPQDSGHYTLQAVGQDPPSTSVDITLCKRYHI